MNKTDVAESWNERKGRLKMKFRSLTDNDLMFEECRTEEMLKRLQIKLGKSKDELSVIIANM